ncbi:hypothetical protein HPB50_001556 [Hyalomma asiaticum]|uniref:Uncharacterized protein n=1 Tax=Hyalomma asiaticum TaxID=266040 RepID=A0ACB7SSE0_HYAAI|nr:hypothetical protein HPB50_001556 [Hyalomma asiaticum]
MTARERKVRAGEGEWRAIVPRRTSSAGVRRLPCRSRASSPRFLVRLVAVPVVLRAPTDPIGGGRDRRGHQEAWSPGLSTKGRHNPPPPSTLQNARERAATRSVERRDRKKSKSPGLPAGSQLSRALRERSRLCPGPWRSSSGTTGYGIVGACVTNKQAFLEADGVGLSLETAVRARPPCEYEASVSKTGVLRAVASVICDSVPVDYRSSTGNGY